MTIDECLERSVQRVDVQLTFDRQRARDIVSAAIRRQTIDEPECPLTLREREPHRRNVSRSDVSIRCPGRYLREDFRRELRHARTLKQTGQRQADAQLSFDRMHELDRFERVESISNDRLVNVDLFNGNSQLMSKV